MASSSSDGVTARPTSAVTNIQSWDEFTEHFVISDSKLVVLVFMAPWSEPWKLMRPVVETMARQLRSSASGEVCALSVDRFNTLGRLLRVEALPTFVLVKKRRAVGRVVGVNREELQASVNKHLAPASSAQSIVDIAAAT